MDSSAITVESIEIGLRDRQKDVRVSAAQAALKSKIGLSPQQIERALHDKAWFFRGWVEANRHELQVQWEVQELKRRHSGLIAASIRKVNAL